MCFFGKIYHTDKKEKPVNLIKLKVNLTYGASDIARMQSDILEKAKKLLKESGVSWGEQGPFLSSCFRDEKEWSVVFSDHFEPSDFDQMLLDPKTSSPSPLSQTTLNKIFSRFGQKIQQEAPKTEQTDAYVARCIHLQNCIAKAVAWSPVSPHVVLIEKNSLTKAPDDISVNWDDLRVQRNQDTVDFLSYVRRDPFAEKDSMNGSVKRAKLKR